MGERLSRRHRDEGSISLVAVGFAIVVAMLLAVVIGGSRVFLAQRDLAGAADSAAAAAAQAVSEQAVYTGSAGSELPIDPVAAKAVVADYVVRAGLTTAFDDFAVLAVQVDGTEVTVRFTARAPVPLGHMLSDAWADGYPVTASATARSPFSAP